MSAPRDRRLYPAHDNPAEIEAAAEVMRLYAEGLNYTQIVEVLDSTPLRTAARGSGWNRGLVRAIIRRGGRPKLSAPKVDAAPSRAADASTLRAADASTSRAQRHARPTPQAVAPDTRRYVRVTSPDPYSPGPVLVFEVEARSMVEREPFDF